MREFHSCKQEEGQSISSYVLKMKSYIANIERLEHPVTTGLGVSLIFISLRMDFDGFVQNYNMHNMGKTINELHAMLKLHVQTQPKNNAPALHTIRKGKNKLAYAPKPKIPPPPKREDPAKDSICHQCDNSIQVSRNNLVYFNVVPRDGIFEIDLSDFYTNVSSIKKRIEKLQHDGILNSTDLRAFEKCVPCMFGKMARKPYTYQVERAKDLLGLIYTDVCGAFKIVSRQRASYFVTFTNDFSRYGYVYLLKHKYEVFETFKVFQKDVENQLRSWVIAHRTPPYMPQHDGVSVRRNRTLLDMVLSMMSQTTLPKSFWDYALKIAARILNMALVKRDTLTKPDKLEPRSIKCNFIGYPKEIICYSFYYPPEKKVLVARNAEFLENGLIPQKASGGLEHLEIIQEEDTHPSIDTSLNHKEDDLEIYEPQSDIIPIRRSIRTRNALDRMCLYIDVKEHELGDLGEPTNYKAALLDPDKWLFKKKTDMDRAVHTYKARLVVKGYTQTPVIDYEETFSPIAYIRDIRILIAIATFYDYEIWQMDVKTAFLNGYLSEEVYIEESEGFVNPKYPNRKNAKQSIFAASSIKAEYIAAFDASKEAVWVRKIISRLGVVPIIEEPISMYCDNAEAITIANESRITKGARHFRAKVQYLHEVIKYGDVKLEKVHTYDNLADPFTKALAFSKHSEHTKDIGVLPASSLM
nr:hypothetical protein [Tanacetum cinerariifolium]